MRSVLVLLACVDKVSDAVGDDTRGDTGEDTGEHTAGDSAGETAPDSGDSADTGKADPRCAEPSVTWVLADGAEVDLTTALLTGTYTTLDQPGRLEVCPGVWFARLLVRADLEVVGLGASPEETVLSGGESGTILDVLGPAVLTVHDVQLDRGAGLDKEHNSGGGGIYCAGFGAVVVEDAVFTRNFANDGAAVYVEDCELTVRRSTFAENLSEDDGGAVTLWYSAGTFEDVTFVDNTALDGGALALFYGSTSMDRVVIQDSTAGNFAGGFWAYNSTLDLRDTAFRGNVNPAGQAGGLLLYGQATLEGVSFEDNTAAQGGGLFVYYEGTVAGTSCNFSGNSAEDIYAADYSDAGGVSYTAGADYSFDCAANVCTPR